MTKLLLGVAVLAFSAGYLTAIGIERAEHHHEVNGDCFCDDCRNRGVI